MGDFRIEVNAVGGHGCEREKKDGEIVFGCRSMTCPDCITARYLADMKRAGVSVKSAVLTHWPGQASQVTDDFKVDDPISAVAMTLTRTRRGSF